MTDALLHGKWVGCLCMLLCLNASAGCGTDAEGEQTGPSGAECSATSDLTYDNFGRDFMDAYCTRCHSSTLSGSARNGAPSGHDFNTLRGIELMQEHVDEQAAAGPLRVNTAMPPDAPIPTEAERRDLGEWVACGLP